MQPLVRKSIVPQVSKRAPVLLSLSGDGLGQGAIQHAETDQLVSPANPAVAGDILIVLPRPGRSQCDTSTGNHRRARMAEVLCSSNTPGFAALYQINLGMPNGVAPEPFIAVRLLYLGRPNNEVTIGVC